MRIHANKRVAALVFTVLMILIITACGNSGSSDMQNADPLAGTQLFTTDPTVELSEADKMALIENQGGHLFDLATVPSIELYPATGPGRPVALPSKLRMVDVVDKVEEEGPSYSKGLRTAFVQQGGNETLWFALGAKKEATRTVVWQVADTPFIGNETDWRHPTGLLAAGELATNAGEFAINFADLMENSSKLRNHAQTETRNESNAKVNPRQFPLFVRAIAIDEDERVLGAPGKGVEVLYGDQLTFMPDNPGSQILLLFPLLSAEFSGMPGNEGEFRNSLSDSPERFYADSLISPWYFRPEGYPADTHTLYLQVTICQPTTDPDDWRDPAGLVYELKVEKGEKSFDDFAVNPYHALPIPVQSFAQIAPTLFHVRAVALANGPVAGTVAAHYSKTVLLKYGNDASEFEYYQVPEPEILDAPLPDVTLIEYQPIRWEWSDWMYYYEVVRQPTRQEYYGTLPGFMVTNPDQLVPGMELETVIKLEPPKDDDDSWLTEAWDAITDVFGSIFEFLEDIANWVSEAYEDLKVDLIAFVASNIPLPEYWQNKLEDALTYCVDYGLVAMGVPPSLPNFDELTDLGVDYLASTALENAGIPANDLTIDTVKKLGGGIRGSASAVAGSGEAPNPMNWNFVKPHTLALYRPAYVLIELFNPSYTETTASGILSGKVFRKLLNSELSDPYKSYMYSAYGGSLHFELYRPVADVQIPRLLPRQTIEVPVFLQEYTGASYPWHPLQVSLSDFLRMYNYFDHFTFSFRIDFNLPPAETYASESGLPDGIYEYALTSRGVSFTDDPAYAYVP